MADHDDDSLEDSVSTISVDSVTYSNLSVSQIVAANISPAATPPANHGTKPKKLLHSIPHEQLVEKLREVEQRENEIEDVLIQNNDLMKLLLESTRDNKSKVMDIKTNNVKLKKEISEYKVELERKSTEIRSFSESDKNTNAQRLKIDQAAAAVKDLRDQLYEKDRLIDRMKTKVEQEYTTLATENSFLKVQLTENESKKLEYEGRCDSLSISLEENQQMIDNLSEQLIKEQKQTDEYKNQIAVLSCQEAVNRSVLESMGVEGMSPGAFQRRWAALAAFLAPSDPGHYSRSGMEGRGLEQSIGATLAASHGEQTAPPSSSPFMEYSEHRPY